MIYYRKLWSYPLVIMAVVFGVITWLLEPLNNFVKDIVPLQNNFGEWCDKAENSLILLVIFLLGLATAWLLIDLISGQALRDIRSIQLDSQLVRHVSDEKVEERLANRLVRRGRLVRCKGKLQFIMPCGSNAAIGRIVAQRCQEPVPKWLTAHYGPGWKPAEKKKGWMRTWVIYEKK